MAFDPSVIGGIADSAVQSQKDAYTLRGMADKDQLAQLEVQNAKSDSADNNTLKNLFQKMPHGSQAEMNALLETASQQGVASERVMKIQRDAQVLAEGNANVELKKLEVAQQQAAPMVSAFDTVLGHLQPFKTMVDQGRMTQAELDAITAQRAIPQIQQLAKDHPELAPHLNQYLQNPQSLTFQGLTTQENSFAQGRAMADQRAKTLKEALDVRREDTNERREDTSERREQAYEKTQLSLASAREKKDQPADVTPSMEKQAQAIAGYRKAAPTSYAMRTPYWQGVMGRVYDINGQYDDTMYAEKSKAVKDFGTGKQGNAARSFNVALSHLDVLEQAGKELQNGNVKGFNTVANKIKEWTGGPAPTNFEATKRIVGDEVVKAVTGSAGALGDREQADKALDAASSPAALQGVIDHYKQLMRGQLTGLKDQYKRTTGLDNFDTAFLSDEARQVEGGSQPGQPATQQGGATKDYSSLWK